MWQVKEVDVIQGQIQDLAMGGAKISSETSYIYERSELRANTYIYTRFWSEYKSAGGGGGGGAVSPLGNFLNLEPLRWIWA